MSRSKGWGVVAVGVVLLIVSGCGLANRAPKDLVYQDLGACRVGVATVPDPPVAGENALTIVVKDGRDQPLRGADLTVTASMPAMGGMPYMESRATAREGPAGVYHAKFGLAMAGDWELSIAIQPLLGPRSRGRWRLSTNAKGVAFGGSDAAAPDTSRANTIATSDTAPGAITIDAARRQSLDIRIDPVTTRDLVADIHAAGRVAYDETRLTDVSPRFTGWVRSIAADFTGQPVRRGQVLFEIYSPDLWAAQREFVQALEAASEDSTHGGGSSSAELAAAARKRLVLFGMSAEDVADIARTRQPRENVPVRSPVSGVITQKNIVLGSPVTSGQIAYAIAPTDPVWVLASVFEQDLALVRTGAAAELSAPGLPGHTRKGRVSFIAPDLTADTRTGTVRIEVPNGDGALKPGMYLDALLHVALGRRLAIPESAVLPTGERRIVFVDKGGGRLEPRDVTLGARAAGWYEVRAGLVAGERVVTSGNFLVASESRLRSPNGNAP